MDTNFTIPRSPFLRDLVHSFWQTDGNPEYLKEIIIPKGIVEIIFNFSEEPPIQVQIGGKQYQLPRCFINGFNTHPIQLNLPSRLAFFGIRFHPTATRYIMGVHAGEFANHSVDLALIDTSMNSLWHQLIEQKNFQARVKIISNWIERRNIRLTGQDQMLNNFLSADHRKVPSARELSEELCYSQRHITRKLFALTGMNTEEVLLYQKYLHSVDLIHNTKLSLTEIAYSCQFADQSHFIKTFKSFALITPGEYRKIKSPLQGHFYQNVR